MKSRPRLTLYVCERVVATWGLARHNSLAVPVARKVVGVDIGARDRLLESGTEARMGEERSVERTEDAKIAGCSSRGRRGAFGVGAKLRILGCSCVCAKPTRCDRLSGISRGCRRSPWISRVAACSPPTPSNSRTAGCRCFELRGRSSMTTGVIYRVSE